MMKYIIFGCGYHGRAVYRKLKSNKKKIIGWVDNDKKKNNKKLFGLLIRPVSILQKINFSKIIFSGRAIDEQLNSIKN